ncbi:LAFA_0G03422g1_1 [Lachancea sp. 'fantastica']|nr:LAFA_0G03422g1_1 [Lachancea sp. 'fantastica']
MVLPTTPLSATKDPIDSSTASLYEVTPTKPLDLNQAPRNQQWFRNETQQNHSRNSQDTTGDQPKTNRVTTDSRYSTSSILKSASELSFQTAYSSGSPNGQHMINNDDAEQQSDSEISMDDATPIVAPSSHFGATTPHLDVNGSYVDTEQHSPDSFNFVENSSNVPKSSQWAGLGLSSTEQTAGGTTESTRLSENFSGQNDHTTNHVRTSPSKISKSHRRSLMSLKRESIHNAYTKTPVEAPKATEEGIADLVNIVEPNEISAYSEDSTLSHDDYHYRLDDEKTGPKNIERKHTFKRSSELELDETNLAYLFIVAIHSFNSQSLKNQDDIAICLSFEKNDIAFVHTVDESGWGEVTLVSNQKRGWVPFNYFSDMIGSSTDLGDKMKSSLNRRPPLAKLLSSSAQFLLHPQDYVLPDGSGVSFSLKYINGIRDGVKFLLETTGCVSRSNELVKNRIALKRSRKLLLADWYNLMIKADSYKYTTDEKRLQTLTNLTFQIIKRGHAFYYVWFIEKQAHEKEKKLGLTQIPSSTDVINGHIDDRGNKKLAPSNHSNFPKLESPPWAVQRLNEVHDMLFSYIALILGRMDMIERNAAGCEVLETVVHQIIILLRELLYISKCCSSVVQVKFPKVQRKEMSLDQSLDPLLSLVSELVSCIKVFVVHSMNDGSEDKKGFLGSTFVRDEDYTYTDDGKRLMAIVSKMTGFIGVAIQQCHRYLKVTGNFQLGEERSYPDLEVIKITSEQFVKRCSVGLTKIAEARQEQRSSIPAAAVAKNGHPYAKKLYRYSLVRAGSNGITPSGSQLLQEVIPDNKPFIDDSSFDKYKLSESESEPTTGHDNVNDRERIRTEMVFDNDGKLLGASNRALIFILTDELDRPSEFLIATYLLNYRSFSSPLDFIAELIARFDLPDKSFAYERDVRNGQYSSRSSRLKNRRRMVCHIFQVWMESYWDYQSDFTYLSTIINFFNEGISSHLPLEARNLIETAAILFSKATASEYQSSLAASQIMPREIVIPSRHSIISLDSVASSKRSTVISVDEHVLEEYELTKLPSGRTSSISIPLPMLNIGTSSLLGRRQIAEMERLTKNYHSMLYPSSFDFSSADTKTEPDLISMLCEWSSLIQRSAFENPPAGLVHNDLNLVELNPLEVAKQLSLIESALFVTVKPGELLNQKRSTSKNDTTSSPDIERIIDFSNVLSNYVIESVVAPKLMLKARVNRLTAWLSIALSSLYFRNFNSVATIMTALQSHILGRLAPIWKGLSDKHVELFHYLSKIVHPNKNYSVYRTKLKSLATDFTPSDNMYTKCHLPSVPFFALFLRDMAIVQEGLNDFRDPSSFRPNRLVNMDKFNRLTKTVSLLQFFQVPYDTNDRPNLLGSGRDSFFNLSGNSDIDTTGIKPVLLLQKFMLYELWRVNGLYTDDRDRGYNLSLSLSPKNEL